VSQLISTACEADGALAQATQTKTPTSLKKAILEQQPQEPSIVVSTFIKILLHGDAFTLVPDSQSGAFHQTYTNRLEHADLLRAFYHSQVRRLRSQFPDLGVKDSQAMSQILQTSSIPGADAALMEALQADTSGGHTAQPVVTPAAPTPVIKKDENLLDSTPPIADCLGEG
jgi:hypothetical protein